MLRRKHLVVFITFLCLGLQAYAESESSFLAGQVFENLRRLGSFSTNRRVDWNASDTHTLAPGDAVWRPASYQPYLAKRFKRLKADNHPVDLSIPAQLLDPTSVTLATLSKALSAALTKAPANPQLHEQAALLLGTLVCREASGRFYDTRLLLCRMTAHLALAQYLAPTPTPVGILAMALLEAEQGHASTALALTATLPDSLADWKQCISVKVTGDWRNSNASQSILYRIIYTRAFLQASSGQTSQRVVDGISMQDERIRNRTDWFRSFLQDPPSRKYVLSKLNQAIQLEAAEMAGVVTHFEMAPAVIADTITLLNTPPGYVIHPDPVGLPTVSVIDWGTWAAHYHRHLCHSLNYVLGEQMIERKFSGLTLYPFIILQHHRKPNGINRTIIKRAIDLCTKLPHRVSAVNRLHLESLIRQAAEPLADPFYPKTSTPYVSSDLRDKPTLGFPPVVEDLSHSLPSVTSWFTALPAGSYYRAEQRFSLIDSAAIPAIIKENPYLPRLIQWQLAQPNVPTSLKELDALVGARSQYDLHIMRKMMTHLEINSEEYHTVLDRVMEISPLAALLKANILYIANDSNAAETYFQKAVDNNAPAQLLASCSPWVIDYRMKIGETKAALDLAKMAASTGNAVQRQRYLRQLEREGKNADAEKMAINMQKHFPVESPLIQFYVYQGRLHTRYQGEKNVSTALAEIKFRPRLQESERQAAMKKARSVIFPGGKIPFRHKVGKPRTGLLISRVKATSGVDVDDIMVAFNKTAIMDVYQYHFMRRESDAPTATLTLWNKTKGYYTRLVTLSDWDTEVDLQRLPEPEFNLTALLAHAKASHTLTLSGMGLTELPKEVVSLKDLTLLDLSDNPLKALPSEIGNLTSLRKLDISSCSLETLPPELGQLKALTSLKAGKNYLTRLPDELAGLTQLEELHLKENDISEFPGCISHLTSLKYLILSNNRITTITNNLANLTHLKAVSLGRNQFTEFPEALLVLPKLEHLIILSNHIQSVPETIHQLTAIRRLDLRGNLLKTLPASLKQLKQLQLLQLGSNCFTTVPECIWEIPSLKELDLGGNGLTQVSPEISKLTKLKRLIVSSNRLDKLPVTLPEIETLRQVHYGGNYFPAEHILVMIGRAKKVKFSGNTYYEH